MFLQSGQQPRTYRVAAAAAHDQDGVAGFDRERQGVGRLIRTKTDKGIIVVLDNRILAKQYGRTFMNAIPKCPVEVV